MSRRYTSELYEDRVKYIKKLMPDACVGGDVIVGFPGEDKNEFDITLEFIKNLEMSYLHVFPYSERANTEAVKMEGTIEMAIRKQRSKMLRILSAKKKRAFYEKNLGTTRTVLFEHENKDGYIKPSFFDLHLKKKFKFLSGPFINFIFNIISENKSSFDIVLDKFKTTVSKEKYLFRPEI